MSNNNMRIWDQVCKTDPAFTRPKSDGRREFTDINPTYRARRITEVFGPCGEGWGYIAEYGEKELPSGAVLAICDVTIWHGQRENTFGPVRGAEFLYRMTRKGYASEDKDAYKKARTDALTKAFADLGESADVYMGQFDDSSYVKEREIAVQRDVMSESTAKLEELKSHLPELTSKPHALNWAKKHKTEIDALDPKHLAQFRMEFQGRLDELRAEYSKKERSDAGVLSALKHVGDIMPSGADEQAQPQDYLNV